MADEKPVTFDRAARARIARSVRWTESGDDPSGQRPVDSGDRWGKVKTAWASTTPNKITVNLCRQDGSETDTSRDWTVYLTTPLAGTPDFCGLVAGDVIAFRVIYDIATATVCGLWAGGNLAEQDFWARITGSAAVGAGDQYTYTFVEVEKTVAGYAAFTTPRGDGTANWPTLAGGRSGTAYNGLENVGWVWRGLGAWCPVAFQGQIVRIHSVKCGATTEYWFTAWSLEDS